MSRDPNDSHGRVSKSHRKDKRDQDKKEKKKRKCDGAEGQLPAQRSPAKKSKSSKQLAILSQSNSADTESRKDSPFSIVTASLYLPLSPICQNYPLKGICAEHLSPLILSYYPPLKAVILSYHNARLSQGPEGDLDSSTRTALGDIIDEFPVSYVWVTADFMLLTPRRGELFEGTINLQNESHIGLICWNLFNASIERERLPRGWKWVGNPAWTPSPRNHKPTGGVSSLMDQAEGLKQDLSDIQTDEGYFEDQYGKKIEGKLQFYVKDMETCPGFEKENTLISIEGTLLPVDEEANLVEQEALRFKSKGGRGVENGIVMSGAQPNEVIDGLPNGDQRPKGKHRVNR